jgi:thiamine biosynthesis lipoprotein
LNLKITERIKSAAWKLCIPAVMAGLLTGCAAGKPKQLESYSAQYLDYFDTVTSITIYTDSEEKFETYKAAVEENMKKYHELYDIYNNYEGMNNVKTINDNAGLLPVTVEPELFDMLKFAVEQDKATNGRMNIAMGSVLSIWHEYREEGLDDPDSAMLPDEIELERANEYTDITKLQMDESKLQVYLPDNHMSLDVGSVAKGYATHQIAQMLREMGVTSALLSLGGNVETIGNRGDGNPWRVGIQNPDLSSPQSYLHVMELTDKALVTSGVYQRFYEVDGERYHHIINPDTLFPWNEYQSVSILTDDSGLGDALSTAVFNMDLETGQAYVESLPNVEAMWILPDNTEVFSSGFKECMSQ